MFTTSIEALTTPEQKEKWLPKALNLDIHGSYGQTEIGHGSNVAALESTAVLDLKTDEFVLNTPTLTSTKWWPGEMGHFANHSLVFARLIIEKDGKKNDLGVAPFLVQTRDLKTHKYMPGIKCGDLGPKLGFSSKDNGWMTMKDVRIPRDQMLMRFQHVDKEGNYSI
mmetsp:Transcript_28325/g.42886  ORF Transcript_28325/g.42886 Transcript_28325/m.42886 type:complete len:167 (-) Transcript_28325:1299-1799(-)